VRYFETLRHHSLALLALRQSSFFTAFFDFWKTNSVKIRFCKCLRPYHVEYTGSRPITEIKQH